MGNAIRKVRNFRRGQGNGRASGGAGGGAGGAEAVVMAGTVKAVPDSIDVLRSATNDVPLFTLEGLVTLCKVVNVYDGDTCKIVLELNGHLAKFNCRMAGYDTPEMRPPRSQVDRDKEIAAAKKARDRLKELVMDGDDSGGKLVVVRCGEFDKYGRLLTELFLNEGDVEMGVKSVNQILVDEGHGYEYNGGTKKAFSG